MEGDSTGTISKGDTFAVHSITAMYGSPLCMCSLSVSFSHSETLTTQEIPHTDRTCLSKSRLTQANQSLFFLGPDAMGRLELEHSGALIQSHFYEQVSASSCLL